MTPSPRPDLAAMLGPVGRALMRMERPILEANGLSMWGYAVLLALGEGPVRTQAAVAEMIGADKTRIIADLDVLQDRGMIVREPDPHDRRVRMVSITVQGRRARSRAQAAIRRQEELMLAQFSAAERSTFLRVARALSDQARAGELPPPGQPTEK
ncbi:MAG: MarR family winged helix-turn-helix transcriptional regulator [Phycicoccus sp.]